MLRRVQSCDARAGAQRGVAKEWSVRTLWSSVEWSRALFAMSLMRVHSLAGVLPSSRKALYSESL